MPRRRGSRASHSHSLRFGESLRSDWRIFFGLSVVLLMGAVAILASYLAPHDPNAFQAAAPLSRPSLSFPMGTDSFGRDQLTRAIYGTRISMGVAAVVTIAAIGIGLPVGLLVGYVGRQLDYWTGRVLDLLLAFPGLLLALALTTILGPSIRTATLALAIVYMPIAIRFIRAAVARERRQDYILAAEISGASTARIFAHHLLPNIASDLLIIGTLIMSFAVLAEAGLSFLGLGVQPPAASLGRMLTDNKSYVTTVPHLVLFPGAAITLLVLALNLLGDGLRDHLDPLQSRKRRIPASVTPIPEATS